MPTDNAFRLSTYLSLALACAVLGYAETSFFPEVTAVAAAAVLALAVLYRVEPRSRLLSLADANMLGLGVGLVVVVWGGVRVARELLHQTFGQSVPWQTFILALVGPILLALIPAKLLRREKHAGDYYALHAAGLAAVALGCSMAGDAAFFVLVGFYLVASLWALAVFFLARSAGRVAPVPRPGPAPPPAALAVLDGDTAGGGRFARRELRVGFLGLLLATGVAVPLFLVTPRSAGVSWEAGKPRVEVGYAADQMLDLNRTGTLRVNPEPAFEVTAEREDDRTPVTDLSPEARWRGATYTDYGAGSWKQSGLTAMLVRNPARMGAKAPRGRPVGTDLPWVPPRFGPAAARFTFAVPAKLKSAVLRDPVAWAPGENPPIASLADDRFVPWYQSLEGSFHRIPDAGTAATLRYVQVTHPPAEPDLGPGFELAPGAESADAQRPFLGLPLPKFKDDIGDKLVDRLIAAGELPPEVRARRDPISLRVREEYHEAVARALARHLAESGEFTYSLKIDRRNRTVDPIEDFLLNTKTGHCERFATALVLLLRSQGVPAVLVLGFKGCEHLGGGRYQVRHDHAHEWVEVLISRPAPGGDGRVYHWLSLDPTPGDDGRPDPASGSWVERTAARGRNLYADYVARYGSDQRQKTLHTLGRALLRWEWLLGLAAAASFAVLTWSGRRWRKTAPAAGGPEAAWFRRMLDALARHGLRPDPGETPREFAARAAAALADRPETAAAADVPARWAEAYYEARFGGRPLTAGRKAELEAALAGLVLALRR